MSCNHLRIWICYWRLLDSTSRRLKVFDTHVADNWWSRHWQAWWFTNYRRFLYRTHLVNCCILFYAMWIDRISRMAIVPVESLVMDQQPVCKELLEVKRLVSGLPLVVKVIARSGGHLQPAGLLPEGLRQEALLPSKEPGVVSPLSPSGIKHKYNHFRPFRMGKYLAMT